MVKVEQVGGAGAQVEAAPTAGPAAGTAQPPQSPSAPQAVHREAWSERMLPWMSRMVLGLTVFFFLASAAQLAYLHYEITNAPDRKFAIPMQMLQEIQSGDKAGEEGQSADTSSPDQRLPAAAVAALTLLELSAIERRYHQANVSLLSRVWTRYLGFVTGMVLAMVGAAFILGRLETASSVATAKTGAAEFSFTSASPGLILAGLGVVMMITAIVTHHEIQVQDRSIYAHGWSFGGNAAQNVERAGTSKPAGMSVKEPEKTGDANEGVATNPALGGAMKKLPGVGDEPAKVPKTGTE